MLFVKKKLLFDYLNCSKKLRKSLVTYNSTKLKKNLVNKLNYSTKNYVREIICQLRKTHRCGFKPKIKKKLTEFYLTVLLKIKLKPAPWVKYLKKKKIDTAAIINLLKVKTKFQYIYKKGLRYCKLFFKFTGSNFFGTITNLQGDVIFSYSSGFFSGLRTRKEKTTVFVAKQLGEVLALRLYKSNAKEITFVPFLNHRRVKTFLRFLNRGLKNIYILNFVRLYPRRKVMRNGVRLRKVARK
tara:strand:- start:2119 stop:2841 length:723 start_codon:yes stop_codon:yes gene_type:complete